MVLEVELFKSRMAWRGTLKSGGGLSDLSECKSGRCLGFSSKHPT